MTASHTLDQPLRVVFDDANLVADAGQILPATPAQHIGLPALIDELVLPGAVDGSATSGEKAITVITSALAGDDCIGDVDVFWLRGQRSGGGSPGRRTLNGWDLPVSAQLGACQPVRPDECKPLTRAWGAGAGQGSDPTTLHVDSPICETCQTQNQGGSRFTCTKVDPERHCRVKAAQ